MEPITTKFGTTDVLEHMCTGRVDAAQTTCACVRECVCVSACVRECVPVRAGACACVPMPVRVRVRVSLPLSIDMS